MKEFKEKFSVEDRIIADEVATEILTVKDEKEDRKYFLLLLVFLICLIFLISSLSFAIFNTYFNGGKNNVIDVGIDVVVDEDEDVDKDEDIDYDKDEDVDKEGSKKPSKPNKPGKPDKPVRPGVVLFSFNEGSNFIDMKNVYPTKDAVGKKLTGDKEYFDFNVSASFDSGVSGKMVYEIVLIPTGINTIDEKDVRVYLTEDGNEVSVLDDMVNNFSDLPDSSYIEGGKVIYRKAVTDDYLGNYVFRMWLSSDADVSENIKRFGCKVAVYAYHKN